MRQQPVPVDEAGVHQGHQELSHHISHQRITHVLCSHTVHQPHPEQDVQGLLLATLGVEAVRDAVTQGLWEVLQVSLLYVAVAGSEGDVVDEG